MHSRTFKLFHRAILERQQITCVQRNRYREICPHVLGHTDGREVALVYQFAGESTSRLPPGGQWRCFYLDDVSGAEARAGPWRSGDRHRMTQKCVAVVYVDVNTDVPNQPGRRLRLAK
jgi:uncharacterized protein